MTMVSSASHHEPGIATAPACPVCESRVWTAFRYATCKRKIYVDQFHEGGSVNAGIGMWEELADTDELRSADFQQSYWQCFNGHMAGAEVNESIEKAFQRWG